MKVWQAERFGFCDAYDVRREQRGVGTVHEKQVRFRDRTSKLPVRDVMRCPRLRAATKYAAAKAKVDTIHFCFNVIPRHCLLLMQAHCPLCSTPHYTVGTNHDTPRPPPPTANGHDVGSPQPRFVLQCAPPICASGGGPRSTFSPTRRLTVAFGKDGNTACAVLSGVAHLATSARQGQEGKERTRNEK